MWRVGLCFCLVIAAGCGRKPLSPFGPVDAGRASIAPVEHDGGSSAPDAGGDGGIGLGRPSAADAGTADTSGDAGDASEPMCPPLRAPDAGADVAASNWGAPTAVPFSCAPMPEAFFFPRPGADVVDAYARCASFADQRASSLAVNGDGSRVALIGVDGIARVVDVPSRTVVGVLAPPRATVGLAAFSPSGDTILTVARGERLVIRCSSPEGSHAGRNVRVTLVDACRRIAQWRPRKAPRGSTEGGCSRTSTSLDGPT